MTMAHWSWVLILLALVDWISTIVLIRAAHQLDEPSLNERAVAATVLTVAATLVAVLALAFIVSFDFPDGVGTAILVAGLLLVSTPQVVWVIAYRRGQFR
jgi:hypothetical protein